jgi:hypothetical protein
MSVKIKKTNKISGAQGSANFILLILLFISSSAVFAQKYDINDPRNPDCPCHKMQQLAEKEFAMLNNQNDGTQNVLNQIVKNQEEGQLANENKNSLSNTLDRNYPIKTSYSKVKRKSKNTWIKKTVFKFSNKYRFKKRKKVNVAICYKWAN